MLKKILIIFSLFFSSQIIHSQTNLLAMTQQNFIYDNSIANFKPLSEAEKILKSFSFIYEPASIVISDLTSEPNINKKYTVISHEDDETNDLLKFNIEDENGIEYTLMLSMKKSKIILIHQLDNETYMSDFTIMSAK